MRAHAYTHTQARTLELAQARLRRFMHVGVTDRLDDSVAAAAVSA